MSDDKPSILPLVSALAKRTPIPGDPYAIQTLTPQDMAQAQPYLNQALNYFPAGVDLQEFTKREVNAFVDKYVFGSETIKEASDAILDNVGAITIVEPTHPLYQQTAETITALNKTTESGLNVPRVVLSENLPTMYHPGTDSMVINHAHTLLPQDQQRGLIAHELGHKYLIQAHGMDVAMYSPHKHAQAVSPEVFQTCKNAGMTDEQIALVLPSDWIALSEHSGFVPGTGSDTLASIGDLLEGLSDPTNTLMAEAWLASSQECKQAVDKVHASIPQALAQTSLKNRLINHAAELGADQVAAKVVGPQAVADGLVAATRFAPDAYIAHDSVELSHPSLSRRLENIGCHVEDGEAICSGLPAQPKKPGLTR